MPLDAIAVCVGTKEFVAGVPAWCHLRNPERDTVLYPAVAYPTYAMGALLAGLRAVPVPVDDALAAGPDGRVRRATRRGPCCCGSTRRVTRPGGLDDLAAAARWGRDRGILVFSDECYAEYTWEGPPRTILGHGDGPGRPGRGGGGALPVEALQHGRDAGGLVQRRPRAWSPTCARCASTPGSWCPGPSSRPPPSPSATSATSRRSGSATGSGWSGSGRSWPASVWTVTCPDGGFYLWVPAPGGDGWAWTHWLAEHGGVLVSPGSFYGESDRATGYVRLAMVAPSSAWSWWPPAGVRMAVTTVADGSGLPEHLDLVPVEVVAAEGDVVLPLLELPGSTPRSVMAWCICRTAAGSSRLNPK